MEGVMQKSERVGDPYGASFGNRFDAAVVVHGGCKVSSSYGVIPPGVVSSWFDVNHYLFSYWGLWSSVE